MFNQLLFKLTQKFPILSKIIHSHDGFIADCESNKDYWFGEKKIAGITLIEDGQWLPYRPLEEYQAGRYTDTMGCTGYGFNNCIEMIARKKFKKDWNKSDRYTNEMTGTTPGGNSMRNVMDITRKTAGLVNESSWAWDRDKFNWKSYYSPIPQNIKNLGSGFLKQYKIGYERVSTNPQLMMAALKESPLYVAGYAWYEQNGLYRSYGRANHAFTVVGYVENSHWLAFDSYPPFVKKLAWDFSFYSSYKIALEDRDLKFNKAKIAKLRTRGFKFIMRTEAIHGAKGQVYELTEDNELQELTDKDKLKTAIKELAKMKNLTGISEELYASLIS